MDSPWKASPWTKAADRLNESGTSRDSNHNTATKPIDTKDKATNQAKSSATTETPPTLTPQYSKEQGALHQLELDHYIRGMKKEETYQRHASELANVESAAPRMPPSPLASALTESPHGNFAKQNPFTNTGVYDVLDFKSFAWADPFGAIRQPMPPPGVTVPSQFTPANFQFLASHGLGAAAATEPKVVPAELGPELGPDAGEVHGEQPNVPGFYEEEDADWDLEDVDIPNGISGDICHISNCCESAEVLTPNPQGIKIQYCVTHLCKFEGCYEYKEEWNVACMDHLCFFGRGCHRCVDEFTDSKFCWFHTCKAYKCLEELLPHFNYCAEHVHLEGTSSLELR